MRQRVITHETYEAILEAMTMISIPWEDLVCAFFPFGRLSKLIIEENLGLSLAVGSTETNFIHES